MIEVTNQSFNVDDIRRVRIEADKRYQGMTPEEISKEISKGAQVGYGILNELRRTKENRQGA